MLRGSFVALITPFTKKGRVDQKRLAELVAWQIAEGSDGIVCCGSTGEGASLSTAERKVVAEVCVEAAAGRPVLVGTGTSDTRQTVINTEKAQAAGAQGCLVVTPYYTKPSQRGCIAHFREVAAVGLPVVVYNNPGRSIVRLGWKTAEELAGMTGIVGWKESSDQVAFVKQIAESTNLSVLAGDDDQTLPMIRAGAVGSISVAANAVPRAWKRMVSAALERRWDEADDLDERLACLYKTLFVESNPQGIKWLLSRMGRCGEALRLPLLPPERTTQELIWKGLIGAFLPQYQKVSN
jgi:4-hydroxy-tetrahydrodipicolinate synthase